MTNDEVIYVLKNTAWLGAEEQAEKVSEAVQMAIDALKAQLSKEDATSDCISRQAAIDAVDRLSDKPIGYLEAAIDTLVDLPSVQPEPSEMTDEQAILHLQSTGWMQNHDREMYESGLREQLADDSGGYDSLIPCEDTISRQAAIDAVRHAWAKGLEPSQYIEELPSVQPEERTEERTETHACDYACDCISRQDAIRWVKTECNPYGKPTLDFESGKRVMEHLKTMPSVQPTYTDAEAQKMQDMEQAQLDKAFELGKESAKAEIIHCGECKHWREGTAFSYCDKLHGMGVLDALDYKTAEDDYCSMAEREDDETD